MSISVVEWATLCLPFYCWCLCVTGVSICFKCLIVLSGLRWRLSRRNGKSSSNIGVWFSFFYPSMFLNNFYKKVKARIGISVNPRELGDFFLAFHRDSGSLAAIGCIALGKLSTPRPGRKNIWLITLGQRSANS